MTALVTGASGFLGGVLARILIEQQERVRALVRPTSHRSHLQDLPIEFIIGDLRDEEQLRRAVEGVSHIYHCAAHSSDWGTADAFFRANVEGVQNLLEAARRNESLQRFVHVSTTDVYGYPRIACDERTDPHDVGLPYNSTKIQGEQRVRWFHEHRGLPTTILRPVSIFGPRGQDFVVELARVLIAGGFPLIHMGSSQAGLVFVDDVAEALIGAAHSPNTVGGAYNLRDPQPMTWLEYTSALARGLHVSPPRRSVGEGPALFIGGAMEVIYRLARTRHRPPVTRHAVYILSRPQDYGIELAQKDFGFAPRLGLSEGINRTIDWLHSAEGRAALAAA